MELQAEINLLRERYKEATKKQEVIETLNTELPEQKNIYTQKPPHKSSGKYLIKNLTRP